MSSTGPYLRFWWKQSPGESVHVAQVHLDAGVGEAQLMEAAGVVPGTDVAFTREGRYGDGVLQLRLRQVIADPAIHVTLRTHKQTEMTHVLYLVLFKSSHSLNFVDSLHSQCASLRTFTAAV